MYRSRDNHLYNGTLDQSYSCRNILTNTREQNKGMPVVAIVNQKGGTGKTTLSINLASAFAELYPTLLMDADPQGSALDWADSRATPQMNLAACGVEPSRLLRDIRGLAPNYAWIIIDGPPGIGRVSADAVRASDIVLIPSKPSPFDVWAASDIVEAVKARQETSGGIPRAFFVITMARPAPVWSDRYMRRSLNTDCPFSRPARQSGLPIQ